ncbi:hypothetical protein H4R34_005389 [Dimargaris verticillata]|uniref:Multiple inositol polyphosphate phosphatase 1 n=1 Tax=Dimargaris verticillata TaxID=2761393 RepID=A0A9W8E771_9FUNG|nr:hypothetical protein H4R34_005389 [Dimargaris verticillata]
MDIWGVPPPSRRRWLVAGVGVLASLSLLYLLATYNSSITVDTSSPTSVAQTLLPSAARYWPFGTLSPYPHSNTTAYAPDPRPPTLGDPSVEADSQCTLAQVQVVSRHGSRNPADDNIAKYQALLSRLQVHWKAQLAQDPSLAWLQDYALEYETGGNSLTIAGRRDLHQLAQRIYRRYQAFWDGLGRPSNAYPGHWHVTSSNTNRTIESANIFMNQLNDAIAAHTDARPSFSPHYRFDITMRPDDTLFHPSEQCPYWNEAYHSQRSQDYIDREQALMEKRFFGQVRAHLTATLRGFDLANDDIVHLYDMCGYENVNYPQAKGGICSLFAREVADTGLLEYWRDIWRYNKYGPGIIQGPSRTLACPMFRQLLQEMQRCRQPTTRTSVMEPCNQGRFWFGHSSIIFLLSNVLQLDYKVEPLMGSASQAFMHSRVYKASWIAPFSANLVFELYRCGSASTGDGPALQFRVWRNEQPFRPHLASCDPETGFCHVDKVLDELSALYQCDWAELCQVP